MPIVVPPSAVDAVSDVSRARAVTVRPSTDGTRYAGGTSVKALVTLLGVPAENVRKLTVIGDGGRSIDLSGDEIANGFGGDPVCGAGCQATLDASRSDSVSFFRPLRSSTDANAADLVDPGIGQPLDLLLLTQNAHTLSTSIVASDSTPAPQQAVTFTAQPNSSGVTYTWYFGDGTSDSGPSVTHRFAAGRWSTTVVAKSGNQFGTATVALTVNDPNAAGGNSTATPSPTGPASANNGSGGSGKSTGSSNGNGGKDAPAEGAQTVPKSGDRPAPGEGNGSSTTQSTRATATPAPSGTATPAPTATAAPGANTPTPAPGAAASSTPPSSGTPISGVLVNASLTKSGLAGALTAADALARDDSASPAVARQGASGGSTPVGSALCAILILGLLGAGAAAELRGSRAALLP